MTKTKERDGITKYYANKRVCFGVLLYEGSKLAWLTTYCHHSLFLLNSSAWLGSLNYSNNDPLVFSDAA